MFVLTLNLNHREVWQPCQSQFGALLFLLKALGKKGGTVVFNHNDNEDHKLKNNDCLRLMFILCYGIYINIKKETHFHVMTAI